MKLVTKFAIQLYTLGDEIAKIGFEEAFRRLAAMGYTGVEFAGYGDVPAAEMKRLLDENHLRALASHVSLEDLEKDLAGQLAYAKTLGLESLVVPYAAMESLADVAALAEACKKLAPAMQQAGLRLGYHNHAHEFATDGGTVLLDALLDAVPADLLDMELDIYWAAYAEQNVDALLERYKGRTTMLHIKQMADYESKTCVDLDEGVLDFAHLIVLAREKGVKHFILEQEEFKVSPWHSAEKGVNYIYSLEA